MEIIIFLLLCVSPIFIMIVIVFGTYLSRKRKRRILMKNIPKEAKIKAPVRINTDKYQERIFKFKGFQASGILYIQEEKLYIPGFKNQTLTFDLRQTRLTWDGSDLIKSGLLQWFAIESSQTGKYYINIETGITAFELGGKITTQELYTWIKNEQNIIFQTPPPITM